MHQEISLMDKSVHLIFWKNGKGLDLHAQVITRLAEDNGLKVTASHIEKPGHYGTLWEDHVQTRLHNWRLHRKLVRQARRHGSNMKSKPYDLCICIEDIVPTAFHIAKRIALVPCQEWFKKSQRRQAIKLDAVICASRLAETIFSRRGAKTYYTGFTTFTPEETEPEFQDYGCCLHVAGRSFTKGTPTVIEAWRRHPEWPMLTVLGTGNYRIGAIPDNVHVIERFLSIEEKQLLQSRHGLHLCPSESESYGHTIAEGMSVAALVITTNAPPMNELITPERGMLVDVSSIQPRGLDYRYLVNVNALEQSMNKVWSLSIGERKALGRQAKESFRQSTRDFKRRMSSVLLDLLHDRFTDP
jgi:hypothetical protein